MKPIEERVNECRKEQRRARDHILQYGNTKLKQIWLCDWLMEEILILEEKDGLLRIG